MPNGSPEELRLTVDYRLSINQMIAEGKYQRGYPLRTSEVTAKNCPIKGTGVVEFDARYFEFDRGVEWVEMRRLVSGVDLSSPWTVGRIEHLLSLGAARPDDQRQFVIVALGSSFRFGSIRAPCLFEDTHMDHKGERCLGSVTEGDFSWRARRFLGVRSIA